MLIVHRPQIVEEPQTDTRWKFAIEPLEPGFGYTLGNSLRRTLLSSIPGAAVTQIRIEGVLHEFSTINGVKEDVTDIILNVKDLVLRSEHDDPVS
ncbi:MAG: DNA-directed RNA polymerase subunit alpha, partial [Actinobacteria bacterium]